MTHFPASPSQVMSGQGQVYNAWAFHQYSFYLDVVFCRCRKICRGRNSNRNSYFRDKISVLIFLTNFIKTSVRKYIRRRVKEQQYGKASRMRYYPASFYTTILDYFVDDPNYCKVILSRFALSEVSLFPLKASLLQ